MTFTEFLSGRWPSRAEVIAAIRRFNGEPQSATEVIRRLAAHRLLRGLGKTVAHFERLEIQDDWRVYQKVHNESRTA